MTLTGKLLLATAAVVVFSGSAMAADLNIPAQPAPVVAPPASTDWDGPYIGASIGYGWGTADDTTAVDSTSLTGFFAGGQVGYNFHLSDNLVAGIEGDVNWSNEQGTFTGADTGDTYRINWDGSVRGRLGVDLDGILPYAEAGVAFANSTFTPTAASAVSATYTGWTVGAGVEFKVADHVSANVEYRYSDYGSQTFDGNSIKLTDNTLRAGVNYHF